MGAFLTELDASLKNGSDTVWVLNSPLVYVSDSNGKIVVPTGFETDFASVPRVPLIYSLWGARSHREAVIHDYVFRKDSIPLVGFWAANSLFLEAMEARGKPWHIRYPMYWGVCLGSYPCFHKRTVDAVL